MTRSFFRRKSILSDQSVADWMAFANTAPKILNSPQPHSPFPLYQSNCARSRRLDTMAGIPANRAAGTPSRFDHKSWVCTTSNLPSQETNSIAATGTALRDYQFRLWGETRPRRPGTLKPLPKWSSCSQAAQRNFVTGSESAMPTPPPGSRFRRHPANPPDKRLRRGRVAGSLRRRVGDCHAIVRSLIVSSHSPRMILAKAKNSD